MMPHRLFRDGSRIPGAGVLLALPALVESGLLRISRKLYGEIGPAFYGLRTSLLTLLFMALLRIQRPEQLKEQDPAALGRLLGLDRAPEVKTLRRKLTRLAAYQRAEPVGRRIGPRARRSARAADGIPVRRWPRARLSRPTQHLAVRTWRAAIWPCLPPPTTGSTIAPATRCW